MTNVATVNTKPVQTTTITRQSARQMPLEQLVGLLEMKNPMIEDIVYSDPRWSEMEEVDAGVVFYPYVPKGALTITRPKHRHPKCVKANPNYIPQGDVLRRVLAWWCAPTRKLSLFMFGETGTGKTEMLMWFADRMNWPISIVQVNETLRPEKAQGSYILFGDKTPFRYGPVSQALKYGWCLILDECDKGSGDFLSKLHTPAEYKPWQLDDTGEILTPHSMFRMCATGNTNGGGDMTGRYHTSQRLDEAFRRRFAFVHCDYPEPAVEDQIIATMYPDISKDIRRKMIKFAFEMRQALRAPQLEAKAMTAEEISRMNLPAERLSCAFSTRVLVGWADYMMIFGVKTVPLKESFDFVFGNSLDDEDAPAVYSIIQRIFGEAFNHPDGWTAGNSVGK